MKLNIHLFAFYLLALSLIPCGDGGGGIVEFALHQFGIEHQEHSDHQQHSNSCGDDACSPFCICNCCSTTVDLQVKPALKIKTPLAYQQAGPDFFSKIYPDIFIATVWQPPKWS